MGELRDLSEYRDNPDRKRKPTKLPLPTGVAEVTVIPSAGAYVDVLDEQAWLKLEAGLTGPNPDPGVQKAFGNFMRTVEGISQQDYSRAFPDADEFGVE